MSKDKVKDQINLLKDQINLHLINSKVMRQHSLKMKLHSNSLYYFQAGGNYGTEDKTKKERSVKLGSKILQKTITNRASS